MKMFKIKVGDIKFIVKAEDSVTAVKKLRDAQAIKIADRSLIGRKVDTSSKYLGKVVDVEYDGRNIQLKVELLEGPGAGQTIYQRLDDIKIKDSAIKDSNFDIVKNAFNKYGVDIIKVVNRQDGSKAIYFDKKDKDIYNKPEIMNLYRSGKLRYAGSGYFVEVLDSSTIKDASIDTKHYAEYGWTIEDSLARNCYWEAVEQLAGKLKTEQDYIREIPKLAKQLFEKYVKEIKNEFERLIYAGRSNTSYFEKWVPEQAKNIVAKQGK